MLYLHCARCDNHVESTLNSSLLQAFDMTHVRFGWVVTHACAGVEVALTEVRHCGAAGSRRGAIHRSPHCARAWPHGWPRLLRPAHGHTLLCHTHQAHAAGSKSGDNMYGSWDGVYHCLPHIWMITWMGHSQDGVYTLFCHTHQVQA